MTRMPRTRVVAPRSALTISSVRIRPSVLSGERAEDEDEVEGRLWNTVEVMIPVGAMVKTVVGATAETT